MATVSPKLTIPFIVGTDKIVGQGDHPEIQIRLSMSAGTDMGPVWVDVPSKLRSYSVKRGRSAELEQVPPAELEAVLDNNDRAFDPTYASSPYSPNLRPGNRVWMRALFSGQTFDRFVGDVNSYTQRWPHAGHDAETRIAAADALQRLARVKLPTMDPTTAQSYADVVAFDNPAGYWRFSDSNLAGSPGPSWTIPGTGGYSIGGNVSPIIGQDAPETGVLFMQSGHRIETSQDAFDTQSKNTVTLEFWFRFNGTPGGSSQVMRGRVNAANTVSNISVTATTSRQLTVTFMNTTPTAHNLTTGALTDGQWYHIAATLDGSTMRLYVDSAEVASVAWTGTLVTNFDDVSTTEFPYLLGHASFNYYLDELAFYPAAGLDAERVAAHYTAGALRGYIHGQTPVQRVNSILDDSDLRARPRRVQPSASPNTRNMRATFKRGQPPIEEIREAERMELADGLLFVSRGGTIMFLDSAHRADAPWNTVQATFGEAGGSELPYTDVVPDYSDAFLVNIWRGQAEGGLLQIETDEASAALYGEYIQEITGLQTYEDQQVGGTNPTAILPLLIVKTKDPQNRIVTMHAHTGLNPDVCEALLRLEVGDRIRVLWTPPAGGSRIDQTSFVQSISETGSREDPRLFFQIGITPR